LVSNSDEMKSVRFASSSPTTTSSRYRNSSVPLLNPPEEEQKHEDHTTIQTIRTLLQYVVDSEVEYN